MNKKSLRIVLICGLALIVASVMIPLVLALLGSANAAGSIIGGADEPIFLLFHSQFSKVFSWFTLIGACLVIGSVIGLIVCKK